MPRFLTCGLHVNGPREVVIVLMCEEPKSMISVLLSFSMRKLSDIQVFISVRQSSRGLSECALSGLRGT